MMSPVLEPFTQFMASMPGLGGEVNAKDRTTAITFQTVILKLKLQ